MNTVRWGITGILLVMLGNALADDVDLLMRRANRFFEPLAESMPGTERDNAERIALGRELFFDKRLSVNDSQSCASCHRLDEGFAGVDNLANSPGARGEFGNRNSPTVLNRETNARIKV